MKNEKTSSKNTYIIDFSKFYKEDILKYLEFYCLELPTILESQFENIKNNLRKVKQDVLNHNNDNNNVAIIYID